MGENRGGRVIRRRSAVQIFDRNVGRGRALYRAEILHDMKRRTWLPIPLIAAALFAAFQYFSAEKVTNPETGISARVALSTQQEQALGLQSYREVLAQSDVVESGPELDLVTRVAQRLARAVGDDARDFEWQVSLVRNDQANAF